MPPRASRSTRTTAAPSRRAARGSAKTSEKASAAATPDVEPAPAADPESQAYSSLETAIASAFSQAQKTTAGHRKLAVNLRGILDQCLSGKGSIGSTIGESGRKGEKLFAAQFCRFLNRVLVVKKSEVVGDRCLRFADMFVRNLVGKDKPKKPAKDKDGDTEMQEEEPEEFEETPATRVMLRILNHLMPFMTSKEKVIRYRTTQFLALLLSNSLPEFPFDYSPVSHSIFKKLRAGLAKRIHDKEATVRVQSAVGLVKLLEMGVGENEDAEEDSDNEAEEGGIVSILIEAMQNDPSSDVRRTILYNLSPAPESLPYLLERSRDVDAATRRSVFTRLLPSLGDFRHLSIGMREKLIRWGLSDRDESVRQAAKKMFNYRWVEDANGDLLEVLERLDVTNEGLDGGPKDLALKGFWEDRQDVVEQLVFDDDYWNNLTPESAFLVRSFNDYCRVSSQINPAAEEKLPEVTRLAYYLQRYLNKLVAALRSLEPDDTIAGEAADLEFVVQQLLLVAASMDYGDEIGRRKMFALLRESLGIVELSDSVTKLVIDSLAKISMGEGDFCRIVLEVIAEIHDTIAEDEEEAEVVDGEESFHSAKSARSSDEIDSDAEDTITLRTEQRQHNGKKHKAKRRKTSHSANDKDAEIMEIPRPEEDEETEEDEEAAREKAIRELMVNMKCLHIAQCMLENVEGNLKQNTTLVTMLNGLVVPSVRSHETPVRERGLRCLGLSCLLDRTLAEENLALFAHCFNKGHENLRIEALHIISDILLCHGAALFDGESCTVEQRTLYRMFAKALKLEDLDGVQASAAEVVCKLMLAQVIQDEELLKALTLSYFDPLTASNQQLRQTLSYFLPVYCHSSTANQSRMAIITVQLLHNLITMHANLDPGEEMVSPTLIASHMADWTDPRKVVSPNSAGVKETLQDPNVQVILAQQILTRASEKSCAKEEKKILVSGLLTKCVLPPDAEPAELRGLYEMVTEAIEGQIAPDATTRNALNKLEVTLGKIVTDLEVGEETVLRTIREDDEEDEGAGEEEEGDDTVRPAKPVGEDGMDVDGEGNAGVSDSDRTPAVTDDESD